jgi:hypothetical protein
MIGDHLLFSRIGIAAGGGNARRWNSEGIGLILWGSSIMSGFGFDDLGPEVSQVHDMSQFMTDDFPPQSNSAAQSPISAPAVKKSKWSPEEDELLRQNVNVHGLGNWSLVAQSIPGRNGKQCRERWMNQLCPSLNKDNWTPQEDMVLVQQQRIYGNVWSQIAQFLPGRSPNAVKNRWSWLSRHSVPPVFVTRILPFAIPQRPPPPPPLRIVPQPRPVMPQIFQTQRTAPADFQWDQITLGRQPRCAFSDGAELSGEWQTSSDTDLSNQFGSFQDQEFGFKEPEREFDETEVGVRTFDDDWSI